jgi:hypothetical protein
MKSPEEEELDDDAEISEDSEVSESDEDEDTVSSPLISFLTHSPTHSLPLFVFML